ncbi:MAG: imidazole glycerol phosphate synthase subunit HisH [Christensenella sp.]|uniref:imidazole glycerol phosphate synthase subunit HisH n=1 Tax=Christensenella sp. TaxID=1935934 RepID=UPI002B202D54|nr:imidazole glycerol phosphate synthase subunit HisH [Christensenella sp.]MEA5004762.1 imidazole glycerol phosphate synthase subunit HisH [Christensenella sp.]
MIAVIDYGMGNLRSVEKAFSFLGYDVCVTDSVSKLRDASHLVLPGVGAIADAVKHLSERGLTEEIINESKSGKPFLGICLGMQLLFDKSLENGEHEALGLIPGVVRPFSSTGLRVPHMGWNTLKTSGSPLFAQEEPCVYFVHSYHADDVPEEYVSATTEYGYDFVSAVQKDNIYGLQFHPEKSGDVGLGMLNLFGGQKA